MKVPERTSGKQRFGLFVIIGSIGTVLLLLIGGYWRFRRSTQEEKPRPWVDTTRNVLRCGEAQVDLTKREAQLLSCLLSRPGEVVPREQLIAEIWTAEGVITGRSLDMYLSRVRKKLARCTDAPITTIRGKGYVFEGLPAS